MLLGTGEVSAVVAHYRLKRVRHPDTRGAAFAKSKRECLIGHRAGTG
jgi:hypothetical protein